MNSGLVGRAVHGCGWQGGRAAASRESELEHLGGKAEARGRVGTENDLVDAVPVPEFSHNRTKVVAEGIK